MKTYYRVQADIDLDAIYKNAENAKKLTKPGTKFMAIVKADAYGHGAIPVAKVLDPIADAYGVAILEEGIELRQAGITKPILILGFTPAPLYPSMIEYDIATAVFQYDMAKKMSDAAVQLGKKAKIHISLDTGMSRIGFALTEESLQTICKINQHPGIEIEGCFSHFARMDEKDKTKAEQQFSRYETFVHKMEQAGVKIPVKHISNSAGIMEMPKVNEDMVRDGICLYGLYPSEEVNKERLPLEPVSRLDMVERIRPRNQRWLQRFRLDMQMVMPALCLVRDVSLFTDREHRSWDASVWISLWWMSLIFREQRKVTNVCFLESRREKSCQ